MRGDSIRDLYAKTLALLGLGVLAGTGTLVDSWPVGLTTPSVPAVLPVGPVAGPLTLAEVGEPDVAITGLAPADLAPADQQPTHHPVTVRRANAQLSLAAAHRPAARTSFDASAAPETEPVPRLLVAADAVALGPAVVLPENPAPQVLAMADSTLAEAAVAEAAQVLEAETLVDGASAMTVLEAAEVEPLARLVPAASTPTADEGDGPVTGLVKKTGSSIVKGGARTGASIFDVVRVVGGMVRRALPAD